MAFLNQRNLRIESAQESKLFVASFSERVLVCTVATDRTSGLIDLEHSCERVGIQLRIFGNSSRWSGMHFKLHTLCLELIRCRALYDYVIYTDGYDSVIAANADCIIRRFLAFDTPLLFSAEATCYPSAPGQTENDYPGAPTKYRFFNAGGFVGRLDYLLEVMAKWEALSANINDQEWWAGVYLSGKTQIKLDHECNIFQCLHGCEDDVEFSPLGIQNRITGSVPCILHANGYARLGKLADHVLGLKNWEIRLREFKQKCRVDFCIRALQSCRLPWSRSANE